MTVIISTVILFTISILCFFTSVLQFLNKGFLFNNAYIYASQEDRKKLNKKPYYRQSAIVFFLIGVIFVLNGIGIILKTNKIFIVVIIITLITVVYAIYSSVKIERNNKKEKDNK